MQTFAEKVNILKAVVDAGGSIDDVELKTPIGWESVRGSMNTAFVEGACIRAKPKTLTRTIITPVPVTLEWAKDNKDESCYFIFCEGAGRAAGLFTWAQVSAGLVFHTAEDAEAALKAFTESMK